MSQIIEAVYEHGVFKPLVKVKLKEHEKINITIEKERSAVLETKASIKLSPEIARLVAESPLLLDKT